MEGDLCCQVLHSRREQEVDVGGFLDDHEHILQILRSLVARATEDEVGGVGVVVDEDVHRVLHAHVGHDGHRFTAELVDHVTSVALGGVANVATLAIDHEGDGVAAVQADPTAGILESCLTIVFGLSFEESQVGLDGGDHVLHREPGFGHEFTQCHEMCGGVVFPLGDETRREAVELDVEAETEAQTGGTAFGEEAGVAGLVGVQELGHGTLGRMNRRGHDSGLMGKATLSQLSKNFNPPLYKKHVDRPENGAVRVMCCVGLC